MLSVKKCKEILEQTGTKKYTDEETKATMNLLYKLARIASESYPSLNQKK